jgi:hypothetical protein
MNTSQPKRCALSDRDINCVHAQIIWQRQMLYSVFICIVEGTEYIRSSLCTRASYVVHNTQSVKK